VCRRERERKEIKKNKTIASVVGIPDFWMTFSRLNMIPLDCRKVEFF
jgi:hypothetical protein